MASARLEISLSSPACTSQPVLHDSTSPLLNSQSKTLSLLDLDPNTVLFLEKLGASQIADSDYEFSIVPGTHKRVLDILQVEDEELWEFVTFKLRYELYDDQRIVIKMPSRFHEKVSMLLSAAIDAAYNYILDDQTLELEQSTKAFIGSIEPMWQSDVPFEINNMPNAYKLLPDNQWGLQGAEPVGLILEVAFTQSFSSIKEKARLYFIGSKFQTRMVIALHIRSDFGIGLSVWKGALRRVRGKEGLHWVILPVKEQEQIEEEGGVSKEGYLEIELGYFGPLWKVKESYQEADIFQEVRIPYSTIVDIVKRARDSDSNTRNPECNPPKKDVLIADPGDEFDVNVINEYKIGKGEEN